MSNIQLPPWAEKMKFGFMMGSAAGMTVGLLSGAFTVLRFGPPLGKTYLGTIGRTMLSHGMMLGFFLSIGSLIRAQSREEDD